MKKKYTVTVNLKDEVLDPEGRAICETLHRLGYQDLTAVRVAKSYQLEFAVPISARVVQDIAEQLLSNTVAEQYHIE